MSEPLLVIDTTYLCHRAFHALGDLEHGGVGTGAVFGVLKDIVYLQDFFKTNRVAFAFDVGRGHRHDILPTYKSSRHARHAEESDVEKEARADFAVQVKKLRTHYLPNAGFMNVFSAVGFEADDIIASICAGLPEDDEAIIVGTDQDLWQCLRKNVWIWNPHKKQAYTRIAFIAEWGIFPRRWAEVKALAGCATDDVVGVRGAGEVTVARFLRGDLPAHHKIHAVLAGTGAREVRDRNMPIVKLPFPGTPKFTIQPDEVTEEKWAAMAAELGMKSIAGAAPRGAERKKRGRKPRSVKCCEHDHDNDGNCHIHSAPGVYRRKGFEL